MALIADSAADRAEQLLILSERLTGLIADETARITRREPTAPPAVVAEKERLANAYRLELARIRDDRSMIDGAPKALVAKLQKATVTLQETLADHEIALGAVKFVAEGLVQAIAEEIALSRMQRGVYGASGGYAGPAGPAPVAVDRSA